MAGLRKTKTRLSLTIDVNHMRQTATGGTRDTWSELFDYIHPSLFQFGTNLSNPPIKALLRPIFGPSRLFCINIACFSFHLGDVLGVVLTSLFLNYYYFLFFYTKSKLNLKWREVLFNLKLAAPPYAAYKPLCPQTLTRATALTINSNN